MARSGGADSEAGPLRRRQKPGAGGACLCGRAASAGPPGQRSDVAATPGPATPGLEECKLKGY